MHPVWYFLGLAVSLGLLTWVYAWLCSLESKGLALGVLACFAVVILIWVLTVVIPMVLLWHVRGPVWSGI